MGVTIFSQQIRSPISPSRIFKALILDSNNLLPKLLPQIIQSIDVIHGQGGAPSIEQINFAQDTGFKYVKNRIDEIDQESFVCKYTLIEGDALGEKLESIAHEIKIDKDSNNGGSICEMVSKYYGKGDYEIKQEEIKEGNDKSLGVFKVVEAYLFENPNAYSS